MTYRVKVKVSYCETYFDFDDINEACTWMATAAEKVAGGDRTQIYIEAIREEDSDGTH